MLHLTGSVSRRPFLQFQVNDHQTASDPVPGRNSCGGIMNAINRIWRIEQSGVDPGLGQAYKTSIGLLALQVPACHALRSGGPCPFEPDPTGRIFQNPDGGHRGGGAFCPGRPSPEAREQYNPSQTNPLAMPGRARLLDMRILHLPAYIHAPNRQARKVMAPCRS